MPSMPSPPVAAGRRVGFGISSICLAVPCCAIVVIVLLVFVLRPRAERRRDEDFDARPPRPNVPIGSPRIHAEPIDDGFWLVLENIQPGTRLRYRCYLSGAPQEDYVVAEGGPRQFVYTGATPSDVSIVEILPPDGGTAYPPEPMPPYPPPPIEPRHRPQPPSTGFGGHPPAYS
jgi:hypothetical protein